MWFLLLPLVAGLGFIAYKEHEKLQALKPPTSSPKTVDGHGTGVIPSPTTTVDGHGTGVILTDTAAQQRALDALEAAKAAASVQAAQQAAASGASSADQQVAAVQAAANVAEQFKNLTADQLLRLSQNPDGTFVPEADAATLLLSGLPVVSK